MFLRRKFSAKPVAVDDPDTVMLDIVAHLTTLMNTRRSAGWFRQDFGTDVTSARTPAQLLLLLEEQIRANVEQYEPRVTIVGMREVYRNGRVKLLVRCRVNDNGRWIRIVASAGGFQVEAVDGDPDKQ